MAWDSQNIADLLSQQVPPPQAQPMPVPVSLNQTPIPVPLPRQVNPVSLTPTPIPDRNATSIDGVFGGGIPTVTTPQAAPLSALQAAVLRRRAMAQLGR